MSPAEFQAETGVDAATTKRLQVHLDSVLRWQRQINLVGSGALTDPWRRHVLDSAQLVPLLPVAAPTIVDLGTGAGFPGVVLAIMGASRVNLVESNARKCVFLAEVLRITATSATIHPIRIERLPALSADVVTARGCANLLTLLDYAAPLLAPTGFCLFLKGRSAQAELTACQEKWKMRVERIPSRSDPTGVILKLSEISPRHDR
ncbi:MAG: 16S rRNA (guanine(527)-N(7))-methyltransferase RsmG [Rhodospirillales bacterium]